MYATDLITRSVVTVGPEEPLAEAIRLMLEHRVSDLPVVGNAGRLIGLLTERDLLHRVETGTDASRMNWLEAIIAPGHVAERYIHTHGHRVEDVMTRDVPTVTETTPLDTVIRLMESHNVRRVPVVDGERLVGIVSRSDLIRALGVLLDRGAAPDRRDDEIRDDVLAEMARHRWVKSRGVDVTVTQGVVEFRGEIFDGRMRAALRVVAEAVPGVREVRDDLVLVDANSVLIEGV